MLKIKLNPDADVVAAVKAKLKESNGYCPCALIHDETTKCMCLNFRQSEVAGECHCGLYIKIEE